MGDEIQILSLQITDGPGRHDLETMVYRVKVL